MFNAPGSVRGRWNSAVATENEGCRGDEGAAIRYPVIHCVPGVTDAATVSEAPDEKTAI